HAVQRRLHGIARLDGPLDPAFGEVEREPPRSLVPLDSHPEELRMALVVDEPAGRVDEPEAAVAYHTGVGELDVVGIDDVQRLLRAFLDQLARLLRRLHPRAKAAEALLHLDGRQAGTEQLLPLHAHRAVAGDEENGNAPVATERSIDAGLADERPVEAEAPP